MLLKNLPLKNYNTFGLDYRADYFIRVKSESELIQWRHILHQEDKPVLVLGGGSNILFTGDFHGIIIHPEMQGIVIEEEHGNHVIVSVGAGTVWDSFVEWAVNHNFGGIENLSFIPGSVGATPVQNIGAYGEEIKDYIKYIRAISFEDGSVKMFSNNDCRFSYRDSIFKSELKGKYLITRVFYHLYRNRKYNLSHVLLKEEVEKSSEISLRSLREAVIRIRKRKLPGPDEPGNAGSFFKNPVVPSDFAEFLRSQYPDMPFYPDPSGGFKLAAGWLIEQCGWKGKRIGDAGVYEKQALILVNHGRATGREILELSEMIQNSVYEKFGIMLEREVEVIQ